MLDKNKSLTHECGCVSSDCECGKRNRFFRGKRMKADDFQIEQTYGIERRRIINRSVIGAGVVNGFAMTKGLSDVGPGFALDKHGREIVLSHSTKLGPGNVVLIAAGASGCRTLPIDQASPDKEYLLSVHYAERKYGEANLPGCGCDKPEHNYVCETAVFSLMEVHGPCPCGEKPCHRTCECGITDSCGDPPPAKPVKYPVGEPPRTPAEVKAAKEQEAREKAAEDRAKAEADATRKEELPPPEKPDRDDLHANRGRGPHACLCHWLMDAPVDCSHPALCDWNGYTIDPAAGVALACVTITKIADECHPFDIDVKDPCGPRDFVKSNDLLYDFIRGCDLTNISWVSWHYWHRHSEPMPWKVFAAAFDKPEATDDAPPVKTRFAVRFSAPVFADSIRFDSVAMRAATIEQSTDWRLVRRIPIVKLDLKPHGTAKLPAGTTNQLQIYVDPDWVNDEISGNSSWLTWDIFEIEIEVYGDGILDCHRLAIDGEAIGIDAVPSGNGSPGGTYRSCFRVEPKPRKRDTA